MGVSGSGKTTIGKKLAARVKLPFFDGDDFHSEANKEKMTTGHALTDTDRAGWLSNINTFAKEQMKKKGAIIACSALKENYRKVLSTGITVSVYWVFLEGSYELIKKRLEERKTHFMPPKLLRSQFETLEEPGDCIKVDISKSPDEIVERIMAPLMQKNNSKN